jgi:hypothetical protein
MNEVTRVLSDIQGGDPHAAEQLLPLVYDELRKLAALLTFRLWYGCNGLLDIPSINDFSNH